jgi:hypothetical protein
MPESYNKNEFNITIPAMSQSLHETTPKSIGASRKEFQVKMDRSNLQSKVSKNEVVPVPGRDEVVPVPLKSVETMPAPPKSMGAGGDKLVAASKGRKVKSALRWAIIGLPLGGVIWASFLPLQPWMHQALVLVVLLWFNVFFLLDTFFMGG